LPGLSSVFRKPKKENKQVETKNGTGKIFLKAMPLKDLTELDTVKSEVKAGNVLILRVTPLANKNLDDVKKAVDELSTFTEQINGDIARLGEERIVICPPKVRIWRETKHVPSEQPIPTTT
jgi:SepF-like predicted cell division protein (DUF552 family)